MWFDAHRLLEQILCPQDRPPQDDQHLLITHDHIDHDAALRAVVEDFTVEHFVDNGRFCCM
jgi:glyoxylase-like metal-dependent hydrolase (beta-lactamase superfamily II)